MSSSNLLESFREAYRNLQLLPLLEPEELARFRVDYGARVMAELEQVVEDCSPVNNKVIFAGHRGCGKSTLLAEFGRRLSDRYFVVFFSIVGMKIETDLKLKPENYRNYQQLLAQIEASDRTLSLLIAVCDDKRLRECIINQYEAELQPEICPYRQSTVSINGTR